MENEKNINKIELTIPDCKGGELKLSHTGADQGEMFAVIKRVSEYLGFGVDIKQLTRKGGGG